MNSHLKNLAPLMGAIVAAGLGIAGAQGLAPTPPMGWNSWNNFGCSAEISEDLYKAAADNIVSSGMAAAGYKFVNIDDCWHGSRVGGVIQASDKFTNKNLIALADYIHKKGLKFGVYTCAGDKTCAAQPGSYGFEDQDIKTYKSWGVDYVKVDWCSVHPDQIGDPLSAYKKFSQAIKVNSANIVLSICNWGQKNPWVWGSAAGGQLWRTTPDIHLGWTSFTNIIDLNANLYVYSGPTAGWNDPDMLEVGRGMTLDEDKSHFGMWCMLAAPLLAGNDVRTMTVATKAILTNTDVIAVDQDALGLQAQRVIKSGDLEVWVRPLVNGARAVALFNRSAAAATITVPFDSLVANETTRKRWKPYPWDATKTYTVRDLWTHQETPGVTKSYGVSVPSHGLAMLKVFDPNAQAVLPQVTYGRGYRLEPGFVQIDLPGAHSLKLLDLNGKVLWSKEGIGAAKYNLPKTGVDGLKIFQISNADQTTTVKYAY